MKVFKVLFVALILTATSCNKDDDNVSPDAAGSDFGQTTSAVIIVNPVINQGSTTTIESGTLRSGIAITAGELDPAETDSTGLAIIKGLPTGSVPIDFSSGTLGLEVIQEKELYDLVVSYTDNLVQYIVPPVRYPIGGDIVIVQPGEDLQSAVKEDNAIVFLAPGVFEGDLSISAKNILVFGSYDEEDGYTSIINGKITVNGSAVRMRGIIVNDIITVNANDFSASFCTFNNADISGNLISLIRNTFQGTNISVPSGNAVLLDNINLP